MGLKILHMEETCCFQHKRGFVQVLHVNGNHWVAVSNVSCRAGNFELLLVDKNVHFNFFSGHNYVCRRDRITNKGWYSSDHSYCDSASA